MTSRLSRPGGRRGPSPAALVAVIVCALLFVLPVAMIAVGSVRDGSPGTGASWTGSGITEYYTQSRSWNILGQSLGFALAVSLFSTTLAAYLGWVSARTDTPGRRLLTPVMVLVLVMPHLFFATGWSLLGGKQGGINELLGMLSGGESGPVDVETWWGIIAVSVLKSTALKYILLLGPMHAMDRSQEEAAFIAGASKVRTFLTVTLPALGPAVLGAFVLGVVVALEYFDIPLILGATAGVDVFATEIYGLLFEVSPPDYTGASALALGGIVLLVVLLGLQRLLLRGRQYTTVRGKTSRQGRWELGAARWAGTAVIAGYTLLTLVLPVLQLVLTSLVPFVGVYGNYTLDNYRSVIEDPTVLEALESTLWLSVAGGATAVLLALLITYVARHERGWAPGFLSLSTWLPWSIPGTALGLGMLWAYLSIPGLSALYGTASIVFLGLVVASTPLAMRTVQPGVGQIGVELEEAARIAGAGRARGFGDAVVRLIIPGLLTGWVLAGIAAAGNLAIPVMLGSSNATTVTAHVFELYSAGRTPEASALLILLLAGIAVLSAVALLGTALLRAALRRRKAAGSLPTPAGPPIIAGVAAATPTTERTPA
ncbi:ABC transporter permease subunit [Nocardia sp. NPDC050799]|uniref:ABC transporter permease n=1 Tax=Nocardia sp. NPDC050799 TaxID=3154842 RepID=UPI0033EFCC1C